MSDNIKQEDVKCGNCVWWEVQYRHADKRPPPLDVGDCKYIPLEIKKDRNSCCSQWNARPPHQDFFNLLCAIGYKLRQQKDDDDDDDDSKPDNTLTIVNVEGMPFL